MLDLLGDFFRQLILERIIGLPESIANFIGQGLLVIVPADPQELLKEVRDIHPIGFIDHDSPGFPGLQIRGAPFNLR